MDLLSPKGSRLRLSAITGALVFTAACFAQDAALVKKVDEIEKQLRVVQKTVEELRGKSAETAARGTAGQTNDAFARIRAEGLERSKAMETLGYLCDVIGPRLTGSPNLRRANDWTREKLSSWGLANAHLEAWGPFGRGWTVQRFSIQAIAPQFIPLIAAPKAWSPGFEKPLEGEVIHVKAEKDSDLENYKGKVKGLIVLAGPSRELKAQFEPLARRMAETNLLRLANAGPSINSGNRTPSLDGAVAPTGPRRTGGFQNRLLTFLAQEGAALVLTPSNVGDGGTLFVTAAAVPRPGAGTNDPPNPNAPRAWSTNAPVIPPQITLAIEDYNRLTRMLQQGEKLKICADLQVQFHSEDLMAYNTVAEIPGSDLHDEVVMLGGHLDSWHSGTGATDNAAGVVAAMEAVRILRTLDLKPRRTIRVGLWSGEEQGLYGSKAYVARHFGYYTNPPGNLSTNIGVAKIADGTGTNALSSTNAITPRELVRGADYEKISVYFNMDNGAGKLRGVYLQNNEAVRPALRGWIERVRDLGADTLSLANTGATDHIPFDEVGIPAFQFIQDPLEYLTRTHHSNQDVLDRVPVDDIKQAAIVMATLVYEAAMADQKLPRKPTGTIPPAPPVSVAEAVTQPQR